jgi:heme-degrading monooxygenase HmoA
VSARENAANWMKQQPGFLSTQLRRAKAGSCMGMNDALWDSADDFRTAFTHPDFVNSLAAYLSSAVAQPHHFTKVAVPDRCAA